MKLSQVYNIKDQMIFSKIFDKFFDKIKMKDQTKSNNNQIKQKEGKKAKIFIQYKHLKNKFNVKILSPTLKQINLNNSYEIQQDNKYFEVIEYFIGEMNWKNNKFHSQLKQLFAVNYFPSLQFQFAKSKMSQQNCIICLQDFQIKEMQKQLNQYSDLDVYMLPCSHKFHIACLKNLIDGKKWVKCPICSMIYGEQTGDQPEGTMNSAVDNNITLPGYQKGAIVIKYSMKSGIRNGVNFAGTSRTAYLPNNDEGKQVLKFFEVAFERKLIFTVGRSVTTGLDNQTVWNGIHHKTSINGGAAHFGYPDPTYLKRVKQQLAAKGITVQSLKNL